MTLGQKIKMLRESKGISQGNWSIIFYFNFYFLPLIKPIFLVIIFYVFHFFLAFVQNSCKLYSFFCA